MTEPSSRAAPAENPARFDPTSPGWWLQVIGVAHAGVGIALHRGEYAALWRDGFIGQVPDRGDRAAAFWFMAAAPALWTIGRLLRSAELAEDADAQRYAGAMLTGLGLTGSAAMPESGFWAVGATGLAALRRARRSRGRDRVP
jgi:hypothetical protein